MSRCVRSFLVALVLPLLASVGALAQTDSLEAQLDALVAAKFPAGQPGAAAIVLKDGRALLRKGYGLANLEDGAPMKPESVCRLGSVTKQFTAAAILMLAEEGKLKLEDEITRFLPDYPTHGKKITVEHLLTHTSGIKSYTNMPEYAQKMRDDVTPAQMIARFRDEPLEFEPGTKFAYDNSGYFLLGMIVEKVSGTTYAEFVQKRIFAPLGMKNSLYADDSRILPNRAAGYETQGDGFVNAAFLSMTQPFAAGALLSTVDDLALWDAALYGERLLKKASRERMWTAHKLPSGESTGYGYGWEITTHEGRPVQRHGGGINGFSTFVLRMPEDKVYVAILTNRSGGATDAGALALRLAALAIGKPVKEKVEIPIDANTLGDYLGRFELQPGFEIAITREGDQLMAQATGQEKFPLYPSADNEFFLKVVEASMTFVRESGKVTKLILHQAGRDTPAPRVGDVVPRPGRKEIEIDPAVFDAYVGSYELAPGFALKVWRDGKHFMTQATGQGPVEIFAESPSRFFLKVVDAQIDFVKDASGKVTHLVLHQGGRDITGKKN